MNPGRERRPGGCEISRVLLLGCGLLLAMVGPGWSGPLKQAYGSGAAGPGRPFHFPHRIILIHARVHGRGPFHLMLDTGSPVSTVDRRAARFMGLPLHKQPYRARGTGGSTVVFRARLLDVEVGPLRVKRLPAVAVDYARLSRVLGVPVHGSLGYSFLRGRVVQIDDRRRRVRWLRTAPWLEPDPPGAAWIRLDFPMKLCPGLSVPCIRGVRLLGLNLDVAIDTGFNQGLFLAPGVLRRLGLDPAQVRTRSQDVVGYGGRRSVKAALLREFWLGPLRRTGQIVLFTGGPGGPRAHRAGCPAVLGNAALADGVLTLDYVHRRIVFEVPMAPADAMPLLAGVEPRPPS